MDSVVGFICRCNHMIAAEIRQRKDARGSVIAAHKYARQVRGKIAFTLQHFVDEVPRCDQVHPGFANPGHGRFSS